VGGGRNAKDALDDCAGGAAGGLPVA